MMEPVALDRLTALDAVLTEDEILTRNTVFSCTALHTGRAGRLVARFRAAGHDPGD